MSYADAILDEVPATYDRAVQVLAAMHATGPEPVDVYCVADPDRRVVRLIEVSDGFPDAGVYRPAPPAGTEWPIAVFPMGPSVDFPFRSEVAQVTPDEWDRLRQGTLKLNRNWGDLNAARQVALGQ